MIDSNFLGRYGVIEDLAIRRNEVDLCRRVDDHRPVGELIQCLSIDLAVID